MSLRRKLAIIAVVYVIEGFPMGVYQDLFFVFFRREGVSLSVIGTLYGLKLAWSAKVLWSPLVDRFGERRQWIAGCLVVMAACLLLLINADAGRLGPEVWLLLALFCLASATQDVAIDAYTIGLVERGEEGPANGMRVTAYRVGLIAAGGGLLYLTQWIGWSGVFGAAALISLAMAGAVFACPRVSVPIESRRETIRPMRRWLGREGALTVFGFVLLYRIGDLAMGPMVKTFWVDRGFADAQIAFVSGTLGVVATVLGAIAGAVIVSRSGIRRSLWVLGGLALASNLGYAGAALAPESARAPVYAASLLESFCAGLASAAFLSFLMRICEKEHAAVQYALLTAIYALPGSFVAVASGWLTEQVGYAAYFTATAAIALPAFAFLPRASAWIDSEPEPASPA